MVAITDKLMQQFMEYVDGYIRDDPTINRLLNKKQFSPSTIKMAVQVAADKIDSTPPLLQRLLPEQYPLNIMLKAATIQLLETANLVDTRNSLPYSDGMLQVKDTHEEGYTSLLQYYSSFLTELKQWKIAVNIDRAMGPMRGV